MISSKVIIPVLQNLCLNLLLKSDFLKITNILAKTVSSDIM